MNQGNPYSLQRVQEALDIIEGPDAPDLSATHYYVRFLPQDTMDMYILIDSLDLDLFSYPFDYDLTLAEMEAHENTLINGYGWQYCLVLPSFQLPTEMASEILDYAYLQSDEPSQTRAPGDQLDPDVYAAAIDKAMQITGYAAPQTFASSNTWIPSAKITYDSDIPGENELSLENLLVRVHTTFNYGDGYTDANGNVTISKGWGGKFKKSVHYHIIWKNDKWKIRDRKLGKVKTKDGPWLKDKWSHHISGDNGEAMWATIHRALNEYFYKAHSLSNGLTKINDINVWAHYGETHEENWNGFFQSNNRNQIQIYSHNSSGPRQKIGVLSTTFHELGHASHYHHIHKILKWNRNTYFHNANLNLLETWARGVQYAYTSSLYPDRYGTVFGYSGDYTGAIESLMWQGISLSQLQTIFMGKTQLEQCRQPVMNLGIAPAWLVDMIFDNPVVPVRVNMNNPITGPDKPELNTSTTYSIPINLPNGVSFDGWTAPGSGCTVTGGLNNRTLTIKFTSYGTYTLAANFTLPDGSLYSASKTIKLTPPPAPTPIVSAWPNPVVIGQSVTFTVTNARPGDTYTWEVNGQSTFDLNGPSITVSTPFNGFAPFAYSPNALPVQPGTLHARCRVDEGGMVRWSQLVTVNMVNGNTW